MQQQLQPPGVSFPASPARQHSHVRDTCTGLVPPQRPGGAPPTREYGSCFASGFLTYLETGELADVIVEVIQLPLGPADLNAPLPTPPWQPSDSDSPPAAARPEVALTSPPQDSSPSSSLRSPDPSATPTTTTTTAPNPTNPSPYSLSQPLAPEYRLHSLLLARHSGFFAAALGQAHFSDSAARRIRLRLDPATAPAWPALVRYCYTDRVALDERNALPLLALARQLLVPDLDAHCSAFLAGRLAPGNCLACLRGAVRFALHDLHAACVEVAAQAFPLLYDADLCGLPPATLLELLGHPGLQAHCELQVVEAVTRYLAGTEVEAEAAWALCQQIRFAYLDNATITRLAVEAGPPPSRGRAAAAAATRAAVNPALLPSDSGSGASAHSPADAASGCAAQGPGGAAADAAGADAAAAAATAAGAGAPESGPLTPGGSRSASSAASLPYPSSSSPPPPAAGPPAGDPLSEVAAPTSTGSGPARPACTAAEAARPDGQPCRAGGACGGAESGCGGSNDSSSRGSRTGPCMAAGMGGAACSGGGGGPMGQGPMGHGGVPRELALEGALARLAALECTAAAATAAAQQALGAAPGASYADTAARLGHRPAAQPPAAAIGAAAGAGAGGGAQRRPLAVFRAVAPPAAEAANGAGPGGPLHPAGANAAPLPVPVHVALPLPPQQQPRQPPQPPQGPGHAAGRGGAAGAEAATPPAAPAAAPAGPAACPAPGCGAAWPAEGGRHAEGGAGQGSAGADGHASSGATATSAGAGAAESVARYVSGLPPPRASYCCSLAMGLPGGCPWVDVALEALWEHLVPYIAVQVSGCGEGSPAHVLSADADCFFETNDSAEPLPWIEIQLPSNVHVLNLQRYTFMHGHRRSGYYRARSYKTQVAARPGPGTRYTDLHTRTTDQFDVAVLGGAAAVGPWRVLRLQASGAQEDGVYRLCVRGLRMYGTARIDLMRQAGGFPVPPHAVLNARLDGGGGGAAGSAGGGAPGGGAAPAALWGGVWAPL